MGRTLRPSIYGLAGLTLFGTVYDSGWFGEPDGHDHSALVVMPSVTTGSTSLSGASYVIISNAVTGDDVFVVRPDRMPPYSQG
jgi:hypothetical protein